MSDIFLIQLVVEGDGVYFEGCEGYGYIKSFVCWVGCMLLVQENYYVEMMLKIGIVYVLQVIDFVVVYG